MRLPDFIRSNREKILVEWEAFARTCAPASITMDVEALRDHAGEMLTVIAADLMEPQDRAEQSEKAKGQAPEPETDEATAAEEHGAGRAESGFTVAQMVAEYRALRASVLRLWTREQGAMDSDDIEDLTRFNEAIDQALAESVAEFNENVEDAKEMFLAILGHDLRTPLGAIYTSATFMIETDDLEEPHRTLTARIAASATRTIAMVGDLLDFTRSRLGGGIPIQRSQMNLAKLVHDVVDEVSAAHPGQTIDVDTRQEQLGAWDGPRISQALSNLIGNAVEHGAPGTAAKVELLGESDEVIIRIQNRGAAIPAELLDGLFNPMKVGASKVSASTEKRSRGGPMGNLGLGLYIAERIVHGHGGRIEVESTESAGTTFTVRLPRREQAARSGA